MSVAVAAHRGAQATGVFVNAVLAGIDQDDLAPGPRIGVALKDADAAMLLPLDLLVFDRDETVPPTDTRSLRLVTVGLTPAADYSARDVVTTASATSFTLVAKGATRPVSLAATGERHLVQALAAIAVAAELGLDADVSIARLESVTLDDTGDFERVAGPAGGATGVDLFDDGFDLGSISTVEALKSVAEIAGASRRTIAVLGPLALASADPYDIRDEHDRIGRIVVRLNIGQLVVVGSGARHLASAAGLEGSWDGESVLVETADEAYDLLRAEIRDGDVVLVKLPSSGLPTLAERIGGALA